MAQRFIRIGAAARTIGIHPATARRWADLGVLPSFRGPGNPGQRFIGTDGIRRLARVRTTDAKPRSPRDG